MLKKQAGFGLWAVLISLVVLAVVASIGLFVFHKSPVTPSPTAPSTPASYISVEGTLDDITSCGGTEEVDSPCGWVLKSTTETYELQGSAMLPYEAQNNSYVGKNFTVKGSLHKGAKNSFGLTEPDSITVSAVTLDQAPSQSSTQVTYNKGIVVPTDSQARAERLGYYCPSWDSDGQFSSNICFSLDK